ncbi:spore germination protein [Bacillus sp. FJAT-44742]|uniref:spore germination protein n=1 Tax=Bacillus sp. FJAT-44742 TaxID=2014005 RepID=UPI000C24CDC4|nr:spore germination protein [Bacillus sp. FJAT-44742]
MKRSLLHPKSTQEQENSSPSLKEVLRHFERCDDLIERKTPDADTTVLYFNHLVEEDKLERNLLGPLREKKEADINELFIEEQSAVGKKTAEVVDGILSGEAAVFWKNQTFLIDVYGPESRTVQSSETETVVSGPHDAFVETLGTNLSLIRRRIKSFDLKIEFFEVGAVTKTDVALLYMEGRAEEETVEEMKKRITSVQMDSVFESTMLAQYIDDHPNSLFPQFMTTERPDLISSKLVDGKVAAMVDGSPSALMTPTSFFEFFASPDDFYQRWILSSATRLLRLVAFLITLTFTAFYVAVITYHYELIPEDLLLQIASSRAQVPFPPLVEALMMEFTIELLREAGARLPTKIGQTIGIVGGIVIGQAAVQAGIASGILLVTVAISAIASFVIPSYLMSTAIRVIRFGLIILAGFLGHFGLVVGLVFIIIHLASLQNVRTSYMVPLTPLVLRDMLFTFIRGPYWARPKGTREKYIK